MTGSRDAALNYIAYQAGWLAAVAGAAWGHEVLGGSVALVLTGAHVALARQRGVEAALVGAAALTGVLVESWQREAGTYLWLAGATDGWPPLWLLALWAQFATTFRGCLAGVLARPVVAAGLGALGGPLAFLAGARLGAVALAAPLGPGLSRLALAWGLALFALAWLTRALDRGAGSAGYRIAAARQPPAADQTASSRSSEAT